MTSNTTPATKTKNPRKPFPVIDPASLVDLPGTYKMNEFQACTYLGMSVYTLRQWRFKGVGPGYVKMGSSVRYAKSDLDAFLASRTIAPQA